MEVLTFNVDKDRRNLTNDVQNFDIDFKNSPSWVQARQYENQMRQVQVNVQHGDGTPFDLTGANPVLEGFMPDGFHRIIDAKHGVMIDPVNGQFRFDFPAPVFAVSGSYKQIFFRLYRAGNNIATLEFSMEVLADKVISGLIPADYVTPIEDIMDKAETVFNNATGDIDAIKKSWAAKLQDLFDSLSKTGKDTADALMQVQAGLTTLEAQIKSDGLMTQSDLDNALAPIVGTISDSEKTITAMQKKLDLITPTNIIGGQFDFGGELTIMQKQLVDAFKVKTPVGPNIFNITMITDSHYEHRAHETPYGSWPAGKYSKNHLPGFLYTGDIADVLVANGDDVNGQNVIAANTASELSQYTDRILSTPTKADRYCLLGNHDDNSPFNAITPKDIITDDELKRIFKTSACINGESRDGDSLYFYKDYPDKQIRLIGLNTEDIPIVVNDDGTLKYKRHLCHSYGQQQLNWLINIALANVPLNYQTVIIGHTPLKYGWGDDGANMFNYDLVKGILDAFATGGNFNGASTTDTPDELKASVSCNFVAQGARILVGFFAGHLHRELLVPTEHFNICCMINDVCPNLNDVNTPNEGAMTMISIDTINRKVNLIGFGRATDRNFSY